MRAKNDIKKALLRSILVSTSLLKIRLKLKFKMVTVIEVPGSSHNHVGGTSCPSPHGSEYKSGTCGGSSLEDATKTATCTAVNMRDMTRNTTDHRSSARRGLFI